MSDHIDDRLRHVFAEIVPEPPHVPAAARVARAQAAARPRRRRWLLAPAGALVAAAAVAAAVLVTDAPSPRDRVAPAALPAGATPDPLTAPLRPRAEVTAPAPPQWPKGFAQEVAPWTLVARSDDDRAFLIYVDYNACEAFETVQVEERRDYVLVRPVLQTGGVHTVCLNNRPPVNEVTYVVELKEPLGDRPLLHAPESAAAVAH